MNPLQLDAIIQADGSLMIQPGGTVPVTVLFSSDDAGCKVATIAFGGVNQAVVTFDAMGDRPVSYLMYNPAPNWALEVSVQNIVGYFSTIPTLH